MSKLRTATELKKEYWSQHDRYFTPIMVEALIHEYGGKPATMGEAIYVMRYHLRHIFSQLPLIRKFIQN